MTAERFLLLVGELEARATDLWEREELELQRGAELMVICCGGSSPNAPQQQQSEQPPSPAVYTYESATLLPSARHVVQSPSLIPSGPQFNSSPFWSKGLEDFCAASFGLATTAAGTTDEPAHDAATTSGHGQSPSQPPAWGLHQPMGLFHDAEASIILSHGLLGGGSGGSATARAAKARLYKFDGGGGTATTCNGHNADPFCGLLSCTPVADDFLGSPSWDAGDL
ncbi:hypothetical protein TSOC_003610 [Tetrabaena socialis]|uniref:Uncharacterized protein n=1 Tax=Tetrabaena socialis TaxID=47790 RepID=A0A2J8AB50_9CHLO|nr:hypothetical protein TSOC_003610 [Tetrabaena socialis]|eukprot:PNH09752.1 hypothetical protein TSOC_003610 [Tetrabaena socialis]